MYKISADSIRKRALGKAFFIHIPEFFIMGIQQPE